MGTPMRDYTVTTWADGYGLWHARVSCTGLGWGNTSEAPHHSVHRERARRAIKRELEARGEGCILSLHVVDNEIDHMNLLRSITFAERP